MAYRKAKRTSEDGEIWLSIPELKFEYSVSSNGRVYSNRFGWFLTPCFHRRSGYMAITIKGRHFNLHQLVANAFLGYDFHDKLQVNHIDGNKLNNNVENLEVVTRSENMKHAWKTGLMTYHPKRVKTK